MKYLNMLKILKYLHLINLILTLSWFTWRKGDLPPINVKGQETDDYFREENETSRQCLNKTQLLENAHADLNTLLHDVSVGNTDVHNHKLRTSLVANEPLFKRDG